MNKAIRFDQRVVVVTGAGGGLGREYALEFARRGAAVVVNDLGGGVDGSGRSNSMADKVVEEIVAAGGQAVASYDSVATSAGGEAIIGKAVSTYGRVDALVSNAGTLRNAPIDELGDDILDQMLEVHLKGGFNVARPALRQMKKQKYGRIVLASSAAGMFGNEQQAAYGAAKAGLVGLMNVLSLEGAPFGIQANALLPTAASRMSSAMDPKFLEQAGAAFAALGDKLGNSPAPAFVMPMVVYLCSEACESTHSLYSAALGRFARVYLGLCQGWYGPRDVPATVEQLHEHWAEICDKAGHVEVGSLSGEFAEIASKVNPR